MRVKVIAKRRLETLTSVPDYPVRPSSFVISVGTHAVIIAALLSLRTPVARVDRPVYDELIKPYEHKILFYDFRRKVPEVVPVKKIGRTHDARGAEVSTQTIIAASRKPKSSQVFISVPLPKIELPRDIPAPLFVAHIETVAAPPPPPAPQPLKPKQFVPPKPAEEPPALPMQTPVLDSQAPLLSSPVANPPLPAPRLTFSDIPAPPKEAPASPTPHPGSAKADVAVASLHPVEKVDTPVPNGDRAGRFSKAPSKGEAASGDADNRAALTVPDLTIRNAKPEGAPKIETEEILYTERVRSIPMSTLSVPLRPSSRMIPAGVDAQFKGRSVYTIVIPMEHIPAYAGDWILWFADRGSKAGETPVMRAPVPFRKLEVVDQTPPSGRTPERIQFAATLGKDGRLDGITFLTKTSFAVQHAVFQDVTSWEFQPANCDGVAVDVDVVLEIPFSLPVTIAGNPSR